MSREYTADGHNYSPPLAWSNLPEHTVSVALVCEDPDAGNPPPFVHWVIYNIPSTATGLPENIPFSPDAPMPAEISGAVQGMSGFRRPIIAARRRRRENRIIITSSSTRWMSAICRPG